MFVRLRNWAADAAAGIKIRADYHDLEDDGFADGISHCIARDGQSVITQNIPMNGKRLTAMADPVDPQDAATQSYADTKVADTGDTMTGDLTIKKISPSLVLNGISGSNVITSQKSDKTRWVMYLSDSSAETGGNAGSNFDLDHFADNGSYLGNALFGNRSTGLLSVKANPTAALGISTKQYTDTSVTNMGNLKVNRAGDTITGGLTVNGELVAAANYLRFGYSGGPGYIQYDGGVGYYLGNAGTIWHTGNLNPVQSVRLVAGSGTVCTGVGFYVVGGGITAVGGLVYSSLQYLTPSGWVTVG